MRDLPRPIFLTVGRVAVEKNLEAFLELDLPGTKLVVGDGPARAALARQFPGAVFLGARAGEALAEIYAAADVFVFPSRTDTFGLVLLEALASGVPVAALSGGGAARRHRPNMDLRRSAGSTRICGAPAWRRWSFAATTAAISRSRMTWEASARTLPGRT